MADKPELLPLPARTSTDLAATRSRTGLIARTRSDMSQLSIRELRAAVAIDGKWGMVDQHGNFILKPIYHDIRQSRCGRAAFSDRPLIYSATNNDCRSYFDHGRWDESEPFQLYRDMDSDAISTKGYDPYAGYKGARWGFLDGAGKRAVGPSLTFARNFSEDLAGAALGGGHGFIDRHGLTAIEPRFEAVGDFKDGLAIVRYGGNCGFIDKTGKFAVPPLWKNAWEFSDGLACVEYGFRYGFVNKTGEIAIQPQFDFASDFHDGLAFVSSVGECGYITTSGELSIRRPFESVSNFREGIARVTLNGRTGLIDRDGNVIYEHHSDERDLTVLGRGRVGVEVKPGRWTVLDTSGKAVGGHEFEHIGTYKEGLAPVKDENGWGYIDEDGELAVDPEFCHAMSFSSGLARVSDDEGGSRWGFIDRTGSVTIPFQFEDARGFQHIDP